MDYRILPDFSKPFNVDDLDVPVQAYMNADGNAIIIVRDEDEHKWLQVFPSTVVIVPSLIRPLAKRLMEIADEIEAEAGE